MNFLTIAFVLCGLNFNISYPITYLLRIVGLLFTLGGIRETEAVDRSLGFSRFKGALLLSSAAAAAALIATAAALILSLNESLANALSIITGVASFVTVTLMQYRMIKHMQPMRFLVNDLSLIRRLAEKWRRFAVFASASVACEVIMRTAAPESPLHTYSGLLLLVTRIIMLILLCVMGSAFNAARIDFNIMHKIDLD